MKASAALATLRHLASIRLPAKMTLPTVSLLMREIVPAETFTVLWLDEDCNLHDVYSNHLCPREIGSRFTSEYLNAREDEVYPTHRKFMRGGSRCDLLHARPGYRNTAFFAEFAQPMGFGRVARFAVRNADQPVAAVWVTRAVGDREFARRELERALLAASYIEHILAGGSDDVVCDVPSGDSGWLIANLDGKVQFFAEGTEALLHMAAGVPRNQATLSTPCYEWSQPLLKRLASGVTALSGERGHEIPVLAVRNSSGRYSLRAYRLHDSAGAHSGLIGVQIARQVPLSVRLLESPAVRALPPREKQVCLLLIEGLATEHIAAKMGISTHGVVQHIRSLYNRLGIHRREELFPALIPLNA